MFIPKYLQNVTDFGKLKMTTDLLKLSYSLK